MNLRRKDGTISRKQVVKLVSLTVLTQGETTVTQANTYFGSILPDDHRLPYF